IAHRDRDRSRGTRYESIVYLGSDSSTYKANDGFVSSSAATVSITVGNATPAPQADYYSIPRDVTLSAAAPGVLANDSDADGDSLTAAIGTAPSHGTLTLGSDGHFSYVPASGYVGSDTFTYTASDGFATRAPGTVTIGVYDVRVTATTARSRYEPGSLVLVTGHVIGMTTIERITVNGEQVEAIDAASNFFTRVRVGPGTNVYTV